MEKLLDEMISRGFSIMLEREGEGEEDPYRLKCIVSSAGGMTKIGKGDTLALALIRALSYIVDTLEGYLVDTENERDRALTLLHRNGMVVNLLDEEEVAAMRRVHPSPSASPAN